MYNLLWLLYHHHILLKIILYGIVNFITFIVVHACIEMYDSLWKLELQAVELVGYIVDGMVEVYLERKELVFYLWLCQGLYNS